MIWYRPSKIYIWMLFIRIVDKPPHICQKKTLFRNVRISWIATMFTCWRLYKSSNFQSFCQESKVEMPNKFIVFVLIWLCAMTPCLLTIGSARPGQRSLVLILDVTESMSTDLAEIQQGFKKMFNKISSLSDNPIYNYIFVPFREENGTKGLCCDWNNMNIQSIFMFSKWKML